MQTTGPGLADRRLSAIPYLFIALALSACGQQPTPTPSPTQTSTSAAESTYQGIVAASEFVVGENRFPFVVLDPGGDRLDNVPITVRFYRLGGDVPEFRSDATARWVEVATLLPHIHEDGSSHDHIEIRGMYVVKTVTFTEPGQWGAEFIATSKGAPTIREMAFDVQREPIAPGIGDLVPQSDHPTIRDVATFAELSTRQVERDELHNVSVADVVAAGQPFVVSFATPQFCTSALCGPVTEVLASLQPEYKNRVEFLHIEPFDLQAARNEGRLIPIDLMAEWNLRTEPWTFVVNSDGRVQHRFEGLVSQSELREAIESVLR